MAAWFSLLPEQLSVYEIWLVRIFLLLGILTIGPWIAIIIYDFLLYVWRWLTYDLPWIGGRARGRPKPRRPSLSERPNGAPRRMGYHSPSASMDSAQYDTISTTRFMPDQDIKRRMENALSDE
ncbi:MAG: hypothetical protein Q9159_006001 [Coniocarpon cinnabarinum]